MRVDRFWLILLAIMCFCPAYPSWCAPSSIRIDSLNEIPAPEPLPTKIKTQPKRKEKSDDWHRLDFRMEGKSCPVCLLSIQNKLKSIHGVQDAAVMLRRPYGVSVIYNNGITTSADILEVIRVKEPVIKIFAVNDKKISNIPHPLIPPFMPVVNPDRPAIPGDGIKPLTENR